MYVTVICKTCLTKPNIDKCGDDDDLRVRQTGKEVLQLKQIYPFKVLENQLETDVFCSCDSFSVPQIKRI